MLTKKLFFQATVIQDGTKEIGRYISITENELKTEAYQFVTGPVCHRPSLTQAQFVTGPVCHRTSLSQDQFVTGPVCHRPSLSQDQFVTVTGPVCHRTSLSQAQFVKDQVCLIVRHNPP
ncbi:hypothetical protein ElyMa_002602900 [Elysia marginata]|uniref:Uncharacterized protein n=1 Tax=Elysia marginata TaxID=1093978 RepID=A0AAV4H2E3_9GAST|nr:hypothetical protein ElyMa_002602900 [Elysia marginata]